MSELTVTDKGKAYLVAARIERLEATFRAQARKAGARNDFEGSAYWQCGAAAYADAARMIRETFSEKSTRAPLVARIES